LDRPDQFYGELVRQVASSSEGKDHLTECNIEHLITFEIYKTIIFSVVLYGCEIWSHVKAKT
jgi:hypothetical protein